MGIQYVVRQHPVEEYIDGYFNERSIIGVFFAENPLNLYVMLNEILLPSGIAFAEVPEGSGFIFTQDQIEFQSAFHSDTVQFEQVAFESTAILNKAFQEGLPWKIFVEDSDIINWENVEKPQLLN